MAKCKQTRSLSDGTCAEARDIVWRETTVSSFLCKFTSSSSKVFMVQYRINDGLRRKADWKVPLVTDLCKRMIDVKFIRFMGNVTVKDVIRKHLTDFMQQARRWREPVTAMRDGLSGAWRRRLS